MKCPYHELIFDALDERLSSEQQKQIQEHFICCSECSEYFQSMKKLKMALGELPKFQVPIDFATQVQNYIHQRKTKKFIQRYLKLTWAASILLTIFLAGVWFLDSNFSSKNFYSMESPTPEKNISPQNIQQNAKVYAQDTQEKIMENSGDDKYLAIAEKFEQKENLAMSEEIESDESDESAKMELTRIKADIEFEAMEIPETESANESAEIETIGIASSEESQKCIPPEPMELVEARKGTFPAGQSPKKLLAMKPPYSSIPHAPVPPPDMVISSEPIKDWSEEIKETARKKSCFQQERGKEQRTIQQDTTVARKYTEDKFFCNQLQQVIEQLSTLGCTGMWSKKE